MKVYRIKHKPSGLYYCKYARKLTSNGSVFDLQTVCKAYMLTVKLEYHKQYHPSEFEIKEYELVD